jgi:polysaccharide export outer membrane protein
MDSIVSSEQDQFRSRELAFETDLAHLRASLDRSKKDAQSMASAHRERQNAADSQLKQLQTSRLLKQKGLVTDYNLLTLEQAQNTYRVAVDNAEVEQARADQDIMNLEKAISTKKADRELELIAQTEQAELDLAQTQSNLRYVRDKLVFVSDYGQHKSLDDLRGSVRVTIYRDNAEVEGRDTTEVRAGDVVEVSVVADTQFYSVAPIAPTN